MKNFNVLALAALCLLFWPACKPDKTEDPATLRTADIDGKFANDWFALNLKITKETPGFTSPVAARAFGFTGLTLYEAVVEGMPEFQSLQGHLEGLAAGSWPAPQSGLAYHWGLSANRALGYLSRRLYKSASDDNLNAIAALELQYEQLFAQSLEPGQIERSIEYGETVGKAIYAFSQLDGQDEGCLNNFPASYVVPGYPGAWAPTPPAYQAIPMQPYWGSVRPFLPANVQLAQPAPPPAYATLTNAVLFAQALEVYAVASNLTPEQIRIAKYWNDDAGETATPAGHFLSIATQVLEAENANLAIAAEAYAKVGIGVHDAFIACWKFKYDYNLLRPVTYIRAQLDPTFTPLLNTPPYPEYTSDHAVQSAAAAQILSELFGYNYHFTDRTHIDRADIDGSARSFDSFLEAAREAADSRLYGGVNFHAAIDQGQYQGEKIGRNVGGMEFRR